MKKTAIIFILGLSFALSPLFSSTNVKGFKGLFDIAYPFTLSKGQAAFTFGVNNIDLKTADIDVNRFFVGVGWGIVENLEMPPQGGGEPAITLMGALVANAVYDAVGFRSYSLPITPERVLAGLP